MQQEKFLLKWLEEVTQNTIEELRPLEEAEAIELMELSGKNQLLFKSSKTSKISMVYKMPNGLYGLVEPDDAI